VKQPCCICENTNAHMRLCDECWAKPENAGWSDGYFEQADDHVEWRLEEHDRLRAAYDRAPLPISERVRAIAKLVACGTRTRYRRKDRQGRYRGYRWRKKRYVGVREIARLTGIPKSTVCRIMQRIEG
jgi:hypothetical protein